MTSSHTRELTEDESLGIPRLQRGDLSAARSCAGDGEQGLNCKRRLLPWVFPTPVSNNIRRAARVTGGMARKGPGHCQDPQGTGDRDGGSICGC